MQLHFKNSQHWNMNNLQTFAIIYACLFKAVRQNSTNGRQELYHTDIFIEKTKPSVFFILKIIGNTQSWNEKWAYSHIAAWVVLLSSSSYNDEKSESLCSWRSLNIQKKLFFVILCWGICLWLKFWNYLFRIAMKCLLLFFQGVISWWMYVIRVSSCHCIIRIIPDH